MGRGWGRGLCWGRVGWGGAGAGDCAGVDGVCCRKEGVEWTRRDWEGGWGGGGVRVGLITYIEI